jgi:hypothetical protein
MSATSELTSTLDIGRVIREIFSVLGRNFATFALLAVIMTGVPTAILYGAQGAFLTTGDISAFFGPRLLWAILGGLVAGVSGLILQAAIIHGTVADLNERPVSVGDGLASGLRAFLPLFGIAICLSIAVGLGFLLLIVPGVLMALAWCVAVPSYVIEQRGVFASFERSAELTRGSRGAIFGLFVIYFVAVLVVELVLGVVGGITNFVTIGGFSPITRLVVMPLIQVIGALIGATGTAVLYVELRRIKDGVGPKGLAAIFD